MRTMHENGKINLHLNFNPFPSNFPGDIHTTAMKVRGEDVQV